MRLLAPWLGLEGMRASTIEVTKNAPPSTMVARVMKSVAPRPPNTVCAVPPKAPPASPPPLPDWSRTAAMSPIQMRMWSVSSSAYMDTPRTGARRRSREGSRPAKAVSKRPATVSAAARRRQRPVTAIPGSAGGGGADAPESRGLERGAAHQRPVHLGLGEQRRRVLVVDAPAVEHRDALPEPGAGHTIERLAHH